PLEGVCASGTDEGTAPLVEDGGILGLAPRHLPERQRALLVADERERCGQRGRWDAQPLCLTEVRQRQPPVGLLERHPSEDEVRARLQPAAVKLPQDLLGGLPCLIQSAFAKE